MNQFSEYLFQHNLVNYFDFIIIIVTRAFEVYAFMVLVIKNGGFDW